MDGGDNNVNDINHSDNMSNIKNSYNNYNNNTNNINNNNNNNYIINSNANNMASYYYNYNIKIKENNIFISYLGLFYLVFSSAIFTAFFSVAAKALVEILKFIFLFGLKEDLFLHSGIYVILLLIPFCSVIKQKYIWYSLSLYSPHQYIPLYQSATILANCIFGLVYFQVKIFILFFHVYIFILQYFYLNIFMFQYFHISLFLCFFIFILLYFYALIFLFFHIFIFLYF